MSEATTYTQAYNALILASQDAERARQALDGVSKLLGGVSVSDVTALRPVIDNFVDAIEGWEEAIARLYSAVNLADDSTPVALQETDVEPDSTPEETTQSASATSAGEADESYEAATDYSTQLDEALARIFENSNRELDGSFAINIGWVIKEVFGDVKLARDDFEDFCQCIQRRAEFIERQGAYYYFRETATTPKKQEFNVMSEEVFAGEVSGVFALAKPDEKLHVNQILKRLALDNAPDDVRAVYEKYLETSPLLRRQGKFYKLAPGAQDIPAQDPVPESTITPAPDAADITPEAPKRLSIEDVQSILGITALKEVVALAVNGPGATTEQIRKGCEAVRAMSDEDYESFKQTDFKVMREHIVEQLLKSGITAAWEITGQRRGTRYHLQIDNLSNIEISSPVVPAESSTEDSPSVHPAVSKPKDVDLQPESSADAPRGIHDSILGLLKPGITTARNFIKSRVAAEQKCTWGDVDKALNELFETRKIRFTGPSHQRQVILSE